MPTSVPLARPAAEVLAMRVVDLRQQLRARVRADNRPPESSPDHARAQRFCVRCSHCLWQWCQQWPAALAVPADWQQLKWCQQLQPEF